MKISLTCFKIRRSRLFDSSMNSAISSVERYDLANTVTIIANRLSASLSVSVSVPLRPSAKRKERNPAFDPVRSPISRPYDVFSPISLSAASSSRFFAPPLESYRDSSFALRSRFFSKAPQKGFYVSPHPSINLRKESVKYSSGF